jgi:hypothetical protein
MCNLVPFNFVNVVEGVVSAFFKKYFRSSQKLALRAKEYSCRNPPDSCFSVPVALFPQESGFLFRRNFFLPPQ